MSFICSDCNERLGSFGMSCQILCEKSCLYCVEGIPFLIDENNPSSHFDSLFRNALMFLERKGYLVSTEEDEDLVLVRPNFKSALWDDDFECFCWCDFERTRRV